MSRTPMRLPYRFPREGYRRPPEAWLLERLRAVRPRTWALLGGVVFTGLLLSVWAAVALWQAVDGHLPALRQSAGGVVERLVSPEEAERAAGAAVLSGVVGEARAAMDQYAAELDRVVPGASGSLRAAAQPWLDPVVAEEPAETSSADREAR